MNCMGYLCYVFECCFHCKSSTASRDKNDGGEVVANRTKRTKFYTQPILVAPIRTTNFIQNSIVISDQNGDPFKLYESFEKPVSARNKAVKFRHTEWDIVPKSCSSGDWIMRYANNETNFNPWNSDAKFNHFELVPWRQNKRRQNLMEITAWEPNTPAEIDINSQRILRKLHKNHIKRESKVRKQRLELQKKSAAAIIAAQHRKRHIKVRIVFSIQFHKKMKLLRNKSGSANNSAGHSYVNFNQQLFVVDPRYFSISEHWGYFSQRQHFNGDIQDMIVNRVQPLPNQYQCKAIQSASDNNIRDIAIREQDPVNYNKRSDEKLDYRSLFPKISQMYFNENIASAFKQVPCVKCRKR